MISVDDRSGSGELLPLFPDGVAELSHLEYGDFCFLGNGSEGVVSVGVERKTIHDLINSMTSGRFSGHQLIGLMRSYDYVYLMVEGVWRFHPVTGVLETRQGKGWRELAKGSRRFMAREVFGFLNTMRVMVGVMVLYSGGKVETVKQILALNYWWNKLWESHQSHLAPNKSGKRGEGVELTSPNLVRRVASELPGVGWGKSKAVQERFKTVREMIEASEKEWREIPGIGKLMASKIVEALNK